MRELSGSKNEEVKGNCRKLQIGVSTFVVFMLFTMAILGWWVYSGYIRNTDIFSLGTRWR
jgi:hypothetical protein